jgi:predicted nucleic acid-binding protein
MKDHVFIDTSAFFALMDSSDRYHQQAGELWRALVQEDIPLKTSNYITIETVALLQHRLGFEAADLWYKDILGVVTLCGLKNLPIRRLMNSGLAWAEEN